MNPCCGHGRRESIWSRVQRWRRFGRGISPIRLSFSKPSPIFLAGRIWDRAPDFPEWCLAILLKPRAGAIVHLIESDQRKAAFLRAVSRETGAPAIVHVGRIELELPPLIGQIDGICARALAPLPRLVDWSREHLLKSAIGVFLKGEDWRGELTALTPESSFQTRNIISRTNPAARIIVVEKADSNGTGATSR